MGVVSFLAIIWARKLMVLWAVLTCGAIAASAGLALPKKFEATSLVQVDSIQRNTLTGLVEPRVRVAEFLGQQAAIAGSRTVAVQVIDALTRRGVLSFADYETQWRRETGGELVPGNDARLWAADQLLNSLNVKASAIESTLAITFRSDDPAQAARISNAFSNAYMSTVIEQRKRRARRNAENFSDERRSLEVGLEDAQSELTDFREDSGIVALGVQRLEAAEVELASLTTRLAEARADKAEAASLLNQAAKLGESGLLTIPLPGDILYARQAQARLGAVMAQMSRIAERYGPQYPDYLEAANEKATLERNIMNAIANRAEYHARRAASLEVAVKQQKRDVVKLQETKQAYDVLEKRVEASRATYDLVATRSLEESLQSRVDNVSTFLLARAVPPANPATPPLALIVLLGIVAGGVLGAATALALEVQEGKIRSAGAVAHILRSPVLAEARLPRRRRRARRRTQKWREAA
ncbi:MAG: hypothetical protein AAGJ87_02835 [Pseudomonadota bacterium]